MSDSKAFRYVAENRKITKIREADTSRFLRVGRLSSAGDRSVSDEAMKTVERAYEWSETLRARDKPKK